MPIWIKTPPPTILSVGVIALDLIAEVATFPNPDDKIRTLSLETNGGGNALNAMVCASRLGIQTSIVTKLGKDSRGEQIIDICKKEGIQTNHVILQEGLNSPFTYVIVDKSSQTRTCIHTACAELTVQEIYPELLLLETSLLYLDILQQLFRLQNGLTIKRFQLL